MRTTDDKWQRPAGADGEDGGGALVALVLVLLGFGCISCILLALFG